MTRVAPPPPGAARSYGSQWRPRGRSEPARHRRDGVEVLLPKIVTRRSRERELTRQNIVGNNTKGVDIRRGGGPPRAPLFRRRLRRGHGESLRIRSRGLLSLPGNAEIGEAPFATEEEDVLWFDVAVDDAEVVERKHSLRHIRQDCYRGVWL